MTFDKAIDKPDIDGRSILWNFKDHPTSFEHKKSSHKKSERFWAGVFDRYIESRFLEVADENDSRNDELLIRVKTAWRYSG